MAIVEEATQVDDNTQAKKPGLLRSLMMHAIVGLVCGAIGFSIPLLVPSLLGVESQTNVQTSLEPSFVPFGEVVVNVNEGRMNRYLRLRITLQTSGGPEKEAALTTQVEKKKAIMTSWLLGHLADMSMEDIRGAAGQNRLRREIHDQFNWILFPNGEQAIDDVLFEEFNVQ
jgi:flagellar basal body-associated protein FliL